MGATVVAVGLMAFVGASKAAYADNGCTRIVLKSADAIEKAIPDDRMEQVFADALGGARNYEDAAARVFDRIFVELLPACPSPLPGATILVVEETGGETTVAEAKAAFVATVAPFIEIYAEGQDAANAGARTVRRHRLSARVARALV